MSSVAKFLRQKYSEDKLYLLIAKRNTGSFTYDGIELGGERLCLEIEEELDAIEAEGGRIRKLSMVGYSLGGLVARYAVGLLESKGIFDRLEPVVSYWVSFQSSVKRKAVANLNHLSSIQHFIAITYIHPSMTQMSREVCIVCSSKFGLTQPLSQNFTTLACPHLGVRTPLRGYHNQLWNVIGARTLSESGRQLFIVDSFRDDGRALLAILADPQSIFMAGLRKFRRRTLYANAINDRTAMYYTTSISKTDPFTDLSRVELNFLLGYHEVMLDPSNPVSPRPQAQVKSGGGIFCIRIPPLSELAASAWWWLKRLPFTLGLAVVLPLGISAYLINSGIQTFKSRRRIKLHEQGRAGMQVLSYRVPLLLDSGGHRGPADNFFIQDLREAVEETYEEINSAHAQEFLAQNDKHGANGRPTSNAEVEGESYDGDDGCDDEDELIALERRRSVPWQSTLALTHSQFEMIRNLDAIGWRKYPVIIRRDKHTHAAIIQRFPKKTFSEGKVVLDHWLKYEFLI